MKFPAVVVALPGSLTFSYAQQNFALPEDFTNLSGKDKLR